MSEEDMVGPFLIVWRDDEGVNWASTASLTWLLDDWARQYAELGLEAGDDHCLKERMIGASYVANRLSMMITTGGEMVGGAPDTVPEGWT